MQGYKNAIYRVIAVLVLTVMGATAAGAAAYAVPRDDVITETPSTPVSPTADMEEVTYEEYRALFDALERSDVPRTEEIVDGLRIVTFAIEGFSLGLADVNEEEFSTHISVGFGAGGPYVQFNPTDQRAILAGATAALIAAICAISAGTACAVAGVIVAVAAVYIDDYGLCPNGKDLRVYLYGGGRPGMGPRGCI